MQLAEAEELEAAIAAEREEAEALRAQLGHLESQTAAQVWWGLLLSKIGSAAACCSLWRARLPQPTAAPAMPASTPTHSIPCPLAGGACGGQCALPVHRPVVR